PGPGASPHPAAPAGGGAASGVNTLTAPMPGVVLSISAQPGQSVKRGDALLVLEAMKMKNELRATRDGIIASIPAEVGAQVKFGDELVVFE
ncbi:MAG: acetyl-CoA carboxylase biotin carboxyl carrier protein subunit, partial [Luteococcus japonicus]